MNLIQAVIPGGNGGVETPRVFRPNGNRGQGHVNRTMRPTASQGPYALGARQALQDNAAAFDLYRLEPHQGYTQTALVSCSVVTSTEQTGPYFGGMSGTYTGTGTHRGGLMGFGGSDLSIAHGLSRIVGYDVGNSDNHFGCVDSQDYVADQPYLVTIYCDTHGFGMWVDDRDCGFNTGIAEATSSALCEMQWLPYMTTVTLFVGYWWSDGDRVHAAMRHRMLRDDPYAVFRSRVQSSASAGGGLMGGVESTGTAGTFTPSIAVGLIGVGAAGAQDVTWNLAGTVGTGAVGFFSTPDTIVAPSVSALGLSGAVTPEIVVNLGDN